MVVGRDSISSNSRDEATGRFTGWSRMIEWNVWRLPNGTELRVIDLDTNIPPKKIVRKNVVPSATTANFNLPPVPTYNEKGKQ